MAPIRWAALAVFIALPIFASLVQSLAGRVVWTVAVAGLPLFIVLVGYHRWRRICPLAFFAQLPVRLRRPSARRASPWLEANYYYVAFSIFLGSLWLRLIATNGNGPALATFFVLIALAALSVGALYTGKTWCNYICPVSFIEKIYTEPHGLRETPNSQCAKCTACKKSCPDINQENGYWKEIDMSPKRFAYYAFPGLVFGFYFYYFLQAGTWEYYFSGSWTNQPEVVRTAFFPGRDAATAGFYFLPDMPRALAALLTLVLCAGIGVVLFSLVERSLGPWLRRREPDADPARVRHVVFTLAAFTAFVTFYTFAGAPTLSKIPWAPHGFTIVVVLTATLSLVRRLSRSQQAFAQETLARGILKRWEWADIQPPKDLRQAFLMHTARSGEVARGYAHVLTVYQDTVRDTLSSGLVTRAEVQRLDSLRSQLQIKQADHEKVMATLAEEERALINDPARHLSVEKRLQLQTYARALERYLGGVLAAAGSPDDRFIGRLRLEYGVTGEEHARVLDEVLGATHGIATRLAEESSIVEDAAETIRALAAEPAPAQNFLADLLHRRRTHAVDRLMHGLHLMPDDEASRRVRDGLLEDDPARREEAVQQLRAGISPTLAVRLFPARIVAGEGQAVPPTLIDRVHDYTASGEPYVRAVALSILGMHGAADQAMLERLSEDTHEVVRETALHFMAQGGWEPSETGDQRGLTTVDKMITLRSVPIFASLAPEDLAELARSAVEARYAPGDVLCVEAEAGNEVFILLGGDVEVLRRGSTGETTVGVEQAGSIIGEMAVLDPAPRAATVRAGPGGVHVLRLDGHAFREALNVDPAVAEGVIHALTRRLRGMQIP